MENVERCRGIENNFEGFCWRFVGKLSRGFLGCERGLKRFFCVWNVISCNSKCQIQVIQHQKTYITQVHTPISIKMYENALENEIG